MIYDGLAWIEARSLLGHSAESSDKLNDAANSGVYEDAEVTIGYTTYGYSVEFK